MSTAPRALASVVCFAALSVLTGCGGIPTDSGQAPHHIYGHHGAVIKLINHRYATCLKALKAGRVKWITGDLYSAVTPFGTMDWSMWTTGTGSIDANGGVTGASPEVLKRAGCKDDGLPISR